MAGRDVVVLESEATIGSATSSRNSEVIHAGLYYPAGSLKARLCLRGREALYRYCRERHIAHRQCGKLIVASDPGELVYLERLSQQALANGVDDCRLVDRHELRGLEPAIEGQAALLSPSTGIIDSHALMQAYVADIEAHGGTIVTNAPVLCGRAEAQGLQLSVGGRDPFQVEARLVVNAAGLAAWSVSATIEGIDAGAMPPRHYAKGSYFTLAGKAPASRLIYPVPEPGGLGVHLTLDLAGQARFGPDVEWVNDIDYDVDPRRAEVFYRAIRRYWPMLADGALQPAYSGVRPKVAGVAEGGGGDFVIQGPQITGHPAYAALYGIESPGLTSSMAIADEAFELDWPDYELLFCVADARDPVVPLIHEAMERHPHIFAACLFGDDRVSANPKLNNCVKGWRAARHEWVVLADSNVLMPPDYLGHLMAAWKPNTGLVCSTPRGSRPDGFWAEVECAFLNSLQARWQYVGEALGLGFAQGKSMLWYKPMLDGAGGIAALGAEIAEDAAATKLVRRLGRKVHLVASPFEQPLGRRSLAQIWSRQTRWARLRRVTFPLFFIPEILLGSVPPLLLVVAGILASTGLGGDVLAGVAAAVLAAVYLPELALIWAKGWRLSVWTLPAMLARDAIAPAIWARSWISGSFDWRGNTMTIGTQTSELSPASTS
eukprot:g25302.t1